MSYNLQFPGAQIDSGISNAYDATFIIALSPPGQDLMEGKNKCFLPIPFDFFLTGVYLDARVPSTGASIKVDINKNGSAIISPPQPLQIDAGETSSRTSSTSPAILTSGFSQGDYLTVDVDQAGSTFSGQDVVLSLYGIRR